jgi:hypothetical protein
MATGAVVARIITQYSDKGSKAARKDIDKLGKQFDAFAKKTRKSFAIAIAASAALTIKIGKDAVEAAIEDSKSQLVLANAMMNTTGATKEAIAAAEDYVRITQFRVNQSDTALRASLATLFVATQDITEAQKLQTIALDVAAATGKDLQSVTIAITKAQQGNVGALKKLSPELSGLISKTTKFEDIMAILGGTYAGTAEQLAQLDPLTTLKLAYGEILETIGLKLLPMVQKFVDQITTVVLPAVDAWVAANGTNLTEAFEGAMAVGFKFLEIAGRILTWANKYKGVLDNIVMATSAAFTIANIGIFIANLGLILTAWTAIAAATGAAATFTAIASFGTAVAAGIGALAMAGLGAATWYAAKSTDSYNDSLGVTTDYVSKLTEKTYGGAAAEKYKAEVLAASAAKAQKIREAQERAAAASAAKAAAAKKKQDAIDKQNLALRSQIEKKYGLKLTDPAEYENIQLKAVQMLQAKQKEADASLAKRIEMRKQELALFSALNQNAQRYTDLLMALADEKLSTAEIELLAKKWGLSVDAAKSYIFTIFAIKDEKVSEEEVDKLAAAWGITKAQAQQYLDFFAALNDGKLSDLEIANLMKKWGMTKEEALKYADFISKIGDGKLDDTEIENLKSKWGLTTQQVVDYILKIGGKVDASGTILSAGDIAALGWTNALNALNAYLAALGKSTGGTPVVTPPTVVIPKPGDSFNGTRTDAAVAAALAKKNAEDSAKAAKAYADAKAKGDMNAAAKAAAGVSPSALAAQESGAIGAASIAAQLRAAEQAKAAADAAARQASSLAAFKAKEAADAAAAQAAADAMDYDEKFRFRAAQGVMSASSGFKGLQAGGNTTVNLTVNGSVTTENDLVQSVRNGLLRGQYNGQSITLEAI